jgi:hypothetical protein
MINKIRRLAMLGAIICVVANQSPTSWGSLRDLLDARAIQWSTLIVQGKLASIDTNQPLGSTTTQPSGWTYKIYTFDVTNVFDGSDKPQQVQVIRFIGPESTRTDPGLELSHRTLGKSYVLMLRPESLTRWSDSPDDSDPRTDDLHALNAYILVHLELSDDLGPDGIADLRHQIADTRAADSQFSPEQARLQARTLARAADETEADQAEQTLENMGYRAIASIEHVMKSVSETGKARLQRVLNAIQVPPIVRSPSSN